MRPLNPALVASAAVVWSLAGCAQVLSLDGYRDGDASATGGAGGAVASVGSGAAPGTEHCDNGVDDDGDGDVDCADDDCGAALCAATAPPGWTGPVVSAATCAAPWSTPAFSGVADIVVPTSTCGCVCGEPQETCPQALVYLHDTNNCSDSQMGGPRSDGCAGILSPPQNENRGVLVTIENPAPAPCTPTPQVDVPAWTATDLTFCALDASGAGCGQGEACVPAPPEPANAVCVYAQGEPACPSSYGYSERTVVYTDGADDSRGCSTCSCALSVGGVCSASATTFDEQQCAGSQTAQAFSGNGCDDSNTVGAASLRVDIALAPGSCAASGGAPEGEVTGRDPITVCCTPPL